jgi:hypothetical protein
MCKRPLRFRYRVDHFLLDREAAAGRSACFASYVACREGQESVKVATQTTAVVIIFRECNKNPRALQQMLKILLA